MIHKEVFIINKVTGFSFLSGKQEVKYDVKMVVPNKCKYIAILKIVFSLGLYWLVNSFRSIALEDYDLSDVELLYDNKKSAIIHINKWKEGFYDNPLY